MMPSHAPSFGLFTGFFRSYPGGTEYASIFRIVFRANPNSRDACRMLMPSTCTALLTRAYTSTLNTSQVSHKTHPGLHVGCNSIQEGYFWTAANRRLSGVSWSIIAPPFIKPAGVCQTSRRDAQGGAKGDRVWPDPSQCRW